MSPRAKGSVTEEHKAAMAEGRKQQRAVSEYLEAIASSKPRRGRPRTPETIDKQLADIEEKIAAANAITRLGLVEQRLKLKQERDAMGATVDLAPLEEAFVAVAKAYGERKGISAAAWKEVGVAADVLKKAGI
jgi:hypothetical protein